MPPTSKRPNAHTGQARKVHKVNQKEKQERSDTKKWSFKVKQSSQYPHRIHVTKPDKSCQTLSGLHCCCKAAYYVNMSPITFRKKLEENKFTQFSVWPDDLGWHINLNGRIFTPGDILEFTTSRGSSRPYPVEIVWRNKSKALWYDSMGKAERNIGVYRGWFSESSELHNGKPFTRRVTPWMELEPYDESLTENMHANTACAPSKGELQHGSDSTTGALLLFIENFHNHVRSGFSKELIPHKYAVVKGKPVNGKTPFMVLNVTVKRCRMYECASEVAYDMKITEKTFERYLRSCDDEGVLWLEASKINGDRRCSRHDNTCQTIESPVRKFYVDPQVMIKQYQGNSLAETNFQNFNTTINPPRRVEVEHNVESMVLEVESAESEVDSDAESIESNVERNYETECEVKNGGTSVFVEDVFRNRIHGLFKYSCTRHFYYLVKGVPANGKVPYMIFNERMKTCRMYDCASEVAADMRITVKEFERLLRKLITRDGIEGKLELDSSAINFSRVRCNWDFDARKKMGIQSPIRKFDFYALNRIIHQFRSNSLTEFDLVFTYGSESDFSSELE